MVWVLALTMPLALYQASVRPTNLLQVLRDQFGVVALLVGLGGCIAGVMFGDILWLTVIMCVTWLYGVLLMTRGVNQPQRPEDS